MKLETSLVEKYGIFMDMEDLADLLKIKRESMYQQIYNGKLDIPHVKRGKKYLFPSNEVAVYLDAKLDETRI
jgi:excisionase family DNA binding protein|tara:strand:- start:178 stop:393 length:216 start_codon:yes stop_codon:yes gene_type:complete